MRLSKRGGTLNWATSSKTKVVPDRHPMKSTEFKKLMAAYGVNDALTAADLFGLSWRTCQRYWYAELPIPGPVARLLRVAVAYKIPHDTLSPKSTRPRK